VSYEAVHYKRNGGSTITRPLILPLPILSSIDHLSPNVMDNFFLRPLMGSTP
jgi:hypothetical protein